MINFNNIPASLKTLRQWCVWKVERTETGRDTKVPYNPVTFHSVSSTDPSTWVDFDTACNGYNRGGWAGIGFVLCDNDPYTFVDLDDPYAEIAPGVPKHNDPEAIKRLQATVADRFAGTYSELSPSGKGLHIISIGKIPGPGRRRHAVEIYSTARFMTMTGAVFGNYPIIEHQSAITWLYDEMGGVPQTSVAVGEYIDREPDDVIIAKCLVAANGAKVRDLVAGNWQLHYPSQSEADQALINIIAYYTKSVWQIARLFRMSGLGKRDKAARDNYVLPMVQKAFDRTPPQIDLDAINNMLNAEFGEYQGGAATLAVNESAAPSQPRLGPADPSTTGEERGSSPAPSMPQPGAAFNPYLRRVPGLLGELAYYIYDQAPRPVPEIALAGAIGLMAGIAGRAYNVSGTGINQYTLLLTGTGRGKEAIQSGISKLMARVTDMNYGGCPAAVEFVGPSSMASGQALHKHLDRVSKSFVSIVGEVDVTLKNMTSKNANAALLKLREMYLSLYSVSGRGNVLGGAAYSDRDKNAAAIASPAYSMIGEGTPERFYNLLDETMVSDGLLPRFNVIEYDGMRVGLNEARANVQPPDQLVKRLAQFCGQALMLNQQGKPIDVETSPEAHALMRAYDKKCDAVINAAHNDTIEQLWNRAHLKVLKLAATVAIGINPIAPVIDANCAQWAIDLIDHSTNKIVAKFARGDIGEGDHKQMADMKRKIKDWYSKIDAGTAQRSYGVNDRAFAGKLFNMTYVHRSCANIASFKNDRMGSSYAVKRTVQTLCDIGVIRKVEDANQLTSFGLDRGSTAHYVLIAPSLLE